MGVGVDLYLLVSVASDLGVGVCLYLLVSVAGDLRVGVHLYLLVSVEMICKQVFVCTHWLVLR